jgi:ABC-type transport system involved in cytochrome c biogenesis permease subunit
LSLSPANAEAGQPMLNAWTHLMDSYKSGDESGFASAAADLQKQVLPFVSDTAADTAKAIAAGQLPDDTIAELHEDARLLTDYSNTAKINRELFYNKFQPFYWTWALYIVALLALILSLMWKKTAVYAAAMSMLAISILFHGFGFVLRCSITGWAPVTNMYETIIWVAMMGAVFAFVLEMVYRHRVIAIGGAVVALLGTIVAASMPPEFGTSIRGLQPVLRSNYWLGIHVLTIVSSYAAFALAMVLGNIVLGQLINGKVAAATIRTNIFYTYRAIQIGVLLVAAGTILGGLWADVSWGKFWSWDAKEVWALIVLLTYLALLHGRFAGWIKQFGLAAGAVLCFSAVLMSWYGVNFVLRAGLHAYGFGSGGQGYMFTFVGLQWVYVITAWLIHKGRQTTSEAASESDQLPNAIPVTGK